ncbi:MAG: SDR family NAD(P)-dependent oxidoreductase [Acidimicrobiia bacterium]
MARMNGKVAVVTGGGNGIGRASALRFAEEGAAGIVVADLLKEAGDETVELIEKAGGRAVFHYLNATSADDNAAAVRAAVDTFGRLDVFMTAAGVSFSGYRSGDDAANNRNQAERMEYAASPWVPFLNLTVDEFQGVLDVNLTGTLLGVQAAARHMVATETRGSIITVASILAKSNDGPVPYNVSKAGVWMLTKVAARVLAPAGVRVNAIGPGYIATNMTTAIQAAPKPFVDQFLTKIPMGRLGEPIDVANSALFLASDESGYMTGEILHPDGGYFTD